MLYTSAKPYFYGTGRRKSSIARVRLYPGSGKSTMNGRDIDEYFGLETLKLVINQPFGVTNTVGKYDIVANVKGGGISGRQARSVTAYPVRSSSLTILTARFSRRQASSRETLV